MLPPGTACPAYYLLPSVVVLTYERRTRYVVLLLGGCPVLVTSSGTRRYLRVAGAAQTLSYYVTTVRHR